MPRVIPDSGVVPMPSERPSGVPVALRGATFTFICPYSGRRSDGSAGAFAAPRHSKIVLMYHQSDGLLAARDLVTCFTPSNPVSFDRIGLWSHE